MQPPVEYSLIIPTYKRPDVLAQCLEHVAALDCDLGAVEVLVYDNGGKDHSEPAIERFRGRLPLTYVRNEGTHGLGYSLNRGLRACRGKKIIELNDDALLPADFLTACDRIFAAEPKVGIIGVRALENGYAANGDGIGHIDAVRGEVVGNFDREADRLLDVEHVYGFCYAYTREVLLEAGLHDEVLLARDYSTGNRIETDHCLTARAHGFRVVYASHIAVRHLAKPRGDYNERSLRWKLNHTRNTLYLFLKHYGLFGRAAWRCVSRSCTTSAFARRAPGRAGLTCATS